MSRTTLAYLADDFCNFFSSVADSVAESTNFVQRKSKLTGSLFFSAIISTALSNQAFTLENICVYLSKKISIKKQGVHKRINENAVNFLSALFKISQNYIRSKNANVARLLDQFTAVYLQDSSIIQLPESMSPYYQSFGGACSKAALKIQVMYDYIKDKLELFEITEARGNDQGYRNHLANIKQGALYLQDLGYFCLESFQTIFAKEAYVITRLLCATKIYDPTSGNELNLLKEVSKYSSQTASLHVCIGAKARLSVRLVFCQVPEEVANKRRCEAKKTAKKKGYTPRKESLALLDWSFYITNISEENADNKQVILLYTVRWQIELFFRLCKSEAQIDKTLGKRSSRVMCEFYAKMISVVILLRITDLIPSNKDIEVSHDKAYKRVGLFAGNFFESLVSTYRMKMFLAHMARALKDHAIKDPRRIKRKSTHQQLFEATQ